MEIPMQAQLYRMVLPDHVCPYGERALELLESSGYEVDDHHLASRDETETFKTTHGVATTPLIFIDGEPIGGYEELRGYLRDKEHDA
jgi:glutaredoxin 3